MALGELRERVLKVIRKNASETLDGVILTVRVDPGSSENYITVEGDEVVFKTKYLDDDSKYNAALIGFLSRELKIPSSKIGVVYGLRGRVKRVLLRDTRLEDLEEKFLRLIRLV